jgi:uncharacterized protein YndB with AHSA1/START domain
MSRGAITEPGRLRRWFAEPKGQLRLGGTFALEGSGHGRIQHCDAPRMLRVTWSSGPDHPDEVEVRLSKAEGRRHAPRARACIGGRDRGRWRD